MRTSGEGDEIIVTMSYDAPSPSGLSGVAVLPETGADLSGAMPDAAPVAAGLGAVLLLCLLVAWITAARRGRAARSRAVRVDRRHAGRALGVVRGAGRDVGGRRRMRDE